MEAQRITNLRYRVPPQRFGWVTEGLSKGPDPRCDIDLCAEEDMAVVPTQGSLVPGWVLIIPRRCAISLARLSDTERERVAEILRSVSHQLSTMARYLFYFEHGASTANSLTGCGVDQAHAHVVPLGFKLFETVRHFDEQETWFEVDPKDPWAVLDPVRDYYVFSDFEKAYAAYPRVKRSQFFRQAIARGLGFPDEWNYRSFPHHENARETIARLGRGDDCSRAA